MKNRPDRFGPRLTGALSLHGLENAEARSAGVATPTARRVAGRQSESENHGLARPGRPICVSPAATLKSSNSRVAASE